MKKGDIVLIPFPFTDLSGAKTRPALVLAVDELDVTVPFVTTQFKWQESWDVKIEPDTENGLKQPSLIKLSQLATLSRDLMLGRIGTISAEALRVVDSTLRKLFRL
ncbi:MAG: type II toxin-antitoxin system PemK/MazF family toxin [Cyclobacteriaceae bacterium]|jgi:mRNA interferase MazF|nr:type II toxin-antitoxin system PemK/MazF family toxin [Flammeovirgaceae bacterium]